MKVKMKSVSILAITCLSIAILGVKGYALLETNSTSDLKEKTHVQISAEKVEQELANLNECLKTLDSEDDLGEANVAFNSFKDSLKTGNMTTDVSLSFRYSDILKDKEKELKQVVLKNY